MDWFFGAVIAALLVTGLIGGGVNLVRQVARWRQERGAGAPILVNFDHEDEHTGRAPAPAAASADRLLESWTFQPGPAIPPKIKTSSGQTAAAVPTAPRPAAPGLRPELADSRLVEGRTITFHQPSAQQTMRLLPGRLEVEEGEDHRTEIRFVDVPGAAPEVTFGRTAGEPFRHVQLRSPTVSREHARMVRESGNWLIYNLSRTNPILINGETLVNSTEGRVLRDADRIEMGEVVFRYFAF